MRVIAFNGSPRKTWNSATLLQRALEGAASQGAETELVHLYDLRYTGCRSCFACKTRGGESYGRCATRDDLAPILKSIEEADAILLGSPIYYGTISGQMKSFLERLAFPYWTYTDPPQSLFPRKIRTAFIYTIWGFDSPRSSQRSDPGLNLRAPGLADRRGRGFATGPATLGTWRNLRDPRGSGRRFRSNPSSPPRSAPARR